MFVKTGGKKENRQEGRKKLAGMREESVAIRGWKYCLVFLSFPIKLSEGGKDNKESIFMKETDREREREQERRRKEKKNFSQVVVNVDIVPFCS